MYEFLLLLGLIWLIVASIQDVKKREIPNWLSFSLIIFALGYRLVYSTLNSNIWFFVYGLFGFAFFFVLAYFFYYARVFAGGDAKLLMGLGPVLSLAPSFFRNIMVLTVFILILMLTGSLYSLLYSFVLVFKNKEKFSKEFKKQFNKRKSLFYVALVLVVISLTPLLFLRDIIFLMLPILILAFPVLFVYAKSIEECCMIKEVKGKELTVGDWLYEAVKVKGKKIEPYWEGLSENEVKILRSVKKVKIKQGIPFVPSFLISYILFLLLVYLRDI